MVYLKEAAVAQRVRSAGHESTKEQAPWRPTWPVPVPAEDGLLDPWGPRHRGTQAPWLSHLIPFNSLEGANERLSPRDGSPAECRQAGFWSLLGGLLGLG